MIIFNAMASSAARILQAGTSVILVLVFMVLLHSLVLAMNYGISRVLGLDRPSTTAFTIHTSQKTLTVSYVVWAGYFATQYPMALIPAIGYHLTQTIMDSILAERFRLAAERAARPPASESPMKIFLLLLFWCLWFFNFSSRTILPPLLPVLENDLGISHTLAGSFFFYLSAGFTISLLAAGWVSARLGFKKSIALATAVFAASLFFLCFGRVLCLCLRRLLLHGAGHRQLPSERHPSSHLHLQEGALGEGHSRPRDGALLHVFSRFPC